MALKIDLENIEVLKHMLKTLKEKLDEEALNNSSTIPFSNKIARIQNYTGLSQDLIEKVVNDPPGQTKLNLASRILILNTVKGLYEQSQLPTYNTIFEETRNRLRNESDQPITAYNEFVEEMHRLGYLLKETVNNSMIVIEDPEITFERFRYLQKLRKFRSNPVQWPHIVYIDERIVSLTRKYEKPMLPDSRIVSNVWEESIFYHAVSSTGFITGMFSNQLYCDEWVTEILLSFLESPCVVIMDTFHGAPENNSFITKHHSKSAMLQWLAGNNIPCRSSMCQAELYELIARSDQQKEHQIERTLRSHGHQVLRLPRHFHDLTITTSLWNFLKNEEMDFSTSLIEKQDELYKKITSLPKETWLEYESKLVQTETHMFDIVNMIESLSDKYELKL